jgi:transcriptional regulator NrdR family protein
MTCPQCTGSDVRPSSSSSWKDALQRLRGRQAFRCRTCRHRFFALPSTGLATNDPDRLQRKIKRDTLSKQWKKRRLFRRVITFAVIVTMFSLFGLFLRYIAQDHPPKDNAEDMSTPNQ